MAESTDEGVGVMVPAAGELRGISLEWLFFMLSISRSRLSATYQMTAMNVEEYRLTYTRLKLGYVTRSQASFLGLGNILTLHFSLDTKSTSWFLSIAFRLPLSTEVTSENRSIRMVDWVGSCYAYTVELR